MAVCVNGVGLLYNVNLVKTYRCSRIVFLVGKCMNLVILGGGASVKIVLINC